MKKIDITALLDAYRLSFTKGIWAVILCLFLFIGGLIPFYIPWVELYHPGYLAFSIIVFTGGCLGCYTIFIAPLLKFIILPTLSKLLDLVADEIKI